MKIVKLYGLIIFWVCLLSCDDKLQWIKVPEKLPLVMDLTPSSGEAGAEIIILGKHFSKKRENNHVTFDGVEADILSSSETELKVIVPEAGSSGPVVVRVNKKQAQNTPLFTYNE